MSMAKRPLPKQLASKLAEVTREIAGTLGDAKAQVLTYSLLLRRWEPTFREQVPETPETPEPNPQDPNPSPLQAQRIARPLHRECISQIKRVLDESDLESVRQYYAALEMDPSIYLHEEFVRAYDPVAAKKRGVHYSPPEVVSFMVRAVEAILQTEFGEGLADSIVVDPCCGIGTFLSHIERRISPLPRTIGLELSAPACELATLLLPHSEIIHGDWLRDFSLNAEGRTLVVIGNPPYSGHSANPGKIGALMADYRHGLTERNPKWLQDDYVKFIRMAQHHVTRAGRGVVAFITNHSYLFNPTFRAMRASLMRDFDLIYTVDLQGNARRNDNVNEPDENVFPIQMGVAISFMVRRDERRECSVRHTEMRGSREQKLMRLAGAELSGLPWTDISCAKPFHVFVPQDQNLREEYVRFPSILDFFGQRSVGFVTSHDAFAVDVDRDALLARIKTLKESDLTPDEIRAMFPIGDLDIERARSVLRVDPKWENRAISVLYRPFDYRWAYYSAEIMERPRLPFMRHMMAENLAIVVGRAGQATGSEVWDVVFCADRPVDLNLFRRGGATVLPRYLYRDDEQQTNVLDAPFDADLLFHYIYAILWSNEYRTRYADFLRLDYPRIPIPRDQAFVRDLAELGRELMDLHLMKRDPATTLEAASARLTIGGYAMPDKYVADRRKTGLTESDQEHVNWIRRASSETIELQVEIDRMVSTKIVPTAIVRDL